MIPPDHAAALPANGADAIGTRQERVVDTLREWAVSGVLDPEEKHSEAGLAARLGVSRTPVRHALAVLMEEGVLQRAGGRGYRVRTYDAADVAAALEMRAAIEGLAARRIAQAGPSPATVETFERCLAEGDAIFRDIGDGAVDEGRYAAMNAAFHEAVVRAAGTGLIREVRLVLDRVPYGSPSAIRFDRMAQLDRAVHLHHAHLQHHYMVAAMTSGDGARAEALFREHGELIKVSLGLGPGPWARGAGRALPIGRAAPAPRRRG